MSEHTDGYYYRTTQGVTEGPLSKEAFDRAQVKGLVKPGFKAWRQKNGAIFQVHVNRKFVVGIDRAKMRLFDVEQSAQEDILQSEPTFKYSDNMDKLKPKAFEEFTY